MIIGRRSTTIEKITPSEIFMYGRSGNDHFDQSGLALLYTVNGMIDHTNILDNLKIVEGTVPKSKYFKQIFGSVHIPDQERAGSGKIQLVNVYDVAEHPHPEEEFYHIRENSGPGELTLGGEKYPLSGGDRYYIPTMISHALKSSSEDESVGVLVMKFPVQYKDAFTENDRLVLNLNVD